MIRFPAPLDSCQEWIDRLIWTTVCEKVGSDFARLVRLASYRDPVTRSYSFAPAGQRFGITLTDRALLGWHERVFDDWLVLPLGRQIGDLQSYLAAQPRNISEVISQDLIPDSTSDTQRKLYISDLQIVEALFQSKSGFSSDKTRPDPIFLSILAIIGDAEPQSLSLNKLSHAVGLSGDWLRHRFKEWTGLGLSTVFRRARMKRAAYLLKTTSAPVKTVAAQCGYEDLSNFSRDFRAVFSVRPSAYSRVSTAVDRPTTVFDHKTPLLTIDRGENGI